MLLVEPIHPDALAWLRERAAVIMAENARPETLLALAAGADAIVIRANGRIDEALLVRAPELRVVARHGVGLDNINVEACTRRGIWVVSTPLANVEAVAEHTVALMLAVAKGLLRSDRAVRAGEFTAARRTVVAEELQGKTLGVVGFGRVGQRVAEIAARAFTMSILFTDVLPQRDAESRLGARRVSLEELLDRSDVVSLHLPLMPQTHHLISADALARLRPGAVLINTSRGPVVDEEALVRALQSGRLSAGLDVYEEEPLPSTSPLVALPNVVLTPHNASHTEGALRAMGMVVEDVMRVLEGETPHHPANNPQGRVSRKRSSGDRDPLSGGRHS